MPENPNDQSGFKVVDRRKFSSDGSAREGVPGEEKEPEKKSTPPRSSTVEFDAESEDDFDQGSSRFDMLVSYLSTTAMFQLGLLAGPSGERIPPDLHNAQRTIDLLEVLQEKTRGNLTPDEAKLLDDVLYELRINFVEASKRRAKSNS